MKPGVKPKPTNLHMLHGTAKNRRKAVKNEPTPKKVSKVPSVPTHFSPDQKKAWRKITPMLSKSGILSEADLPALEVLTRTYADLCEVENLLVQGGAWTNRGTTDKPDWKESLFARKAERLRKEFVRLCAEFGMTPSSRTRIESVGSQGGVNPYKQWKNGG